MGIFEDYIEFHHKYTAKYGPKTLVFYQNGMFFEVYSVDNAVEKLGYAPEISQMLNIQMTRRNKSIIENNRSNFLMCGIPISQRDRYVAMMTEIHNWVVVIVEQIGTSASPEGISRRVTQVISPSTALNTIRTLSNYLMCVYLEGESKKSTRCCPKLIQLLTIGITAVDVTTGHSLSYETYNVVDDSDRAVNETLRMMKTLQPREIIIYSRGLSTDQLIAICQQLELTASLSDETNETHETQSQIEGIPNFSANGILCHVYGEVVESQFYKLSFQNQYLKQIWPETGLLSPIEYANFEKQPTALISFMLLIEYVHQQNELVIKHLEIPVDFSQKANDFLILDNTAITQLHLITSNTTKLGSVANLVDQTSTNLGRRWLRQRLVMPITNPIELTRRWNACETFMAIEESPKSSTKIKLKIQAQVEPIKPRCLPGHSVLYRFQAFERELRGIADLERLHRKIALGYLQPSEFIALDNSYRQVEHLLDMTQGLSQPQPKYLTRFNEFLNYYRTCLSLNDTVFLPGYSQEIDQTRGHQSHNRELLDKCATEISHRISAKSEQMCSIEFTDDYLHHIAITCNRAQMFYKWVWSTLSKDVINQIKSNLSKNPEKIGLGLLDHPSLWAQQCMISVNTTKVGSVTIPTETETLDISSLEWSQKPSGKTGRLTSPWLKQRSTELLSAESKLEKLVENTFKTFQAEFYIKYSDVMRDISEWVAELDVAVSNAKTARLYNYCRPELVENENSLLSVTDLRHPLIERFQSTETYVPNDIDLGQSEKTLGILLFGTNMVGKSSLMRSVGLAVILAQAGLYVPATSFKFRPYETILTRILGNDDLMRGQSTFGTEMTELRGILQRAHPRALVLGDEICHGTETPSGIGLVASALIKLSESARQAQFIFATHLHQLSELTQITSIPTIRMKHLAVTYIPSTGELIYNRKLQDGAGPSIYGIEVARSLGFTPDFIELANQIRREVLAIDQSDGMKTKSSRYNAEVFMNQCGIPECPNPAVDTHHIRFQSNANEHGYVDGVYVHHMSNLIPLCKSCHQLAHHETPNDWRYLIKGYLKTTNGIKLDFEYVQNPATQRPSDIDDICLG
jgi:DNA mismatch repair protein MutS